MDTSEFINVARDAISLKRVYGEPYEKDGVMVITAARVYGGGGGGSGAISSGGQTLGGGYGLHATPIGAFAIANGKVTWVPAIDLNRAILGGQLVTLALVLTFGSLLRTRMRSRAAAVSAPGSR